MYNSIKRLIKFTPEIAKKQRGLPNTGKRPDGAKFGNAVSKINDAFQIYGKEIFSIEPKDKNLKKHNLGGGSPIKFRAFPPAINGIKKSLKRNDLYKYPLALGDPIYKQNIINYLKSEGLNNYDLESKQYHDICDDNIIFTMSTTQAFDMIIRTICRPYDVIIMTGPNYGLFTYIPERHNVGLEILDLIEEESFLPNPQSLYKLITETNSKLKKQFTKNKKINYIPRVVAYFNENPHNPMGYSLSTYDKELLTRIGEVCIKNGVFVVDDLLYRDICFNQKDIALPMASIKGMFRNTITLMGLSKSYNLASIRAGFIVADETVIRGIRDCIFQEMDSTAIIQQSAMSEAFSDTKKRKTAYAKYFKDLRKKYIYSYEILKFMINGQKHYNNEKYSKRIIKDIKKIIRNPFDVKIIMEGIPNINFVKNINIKAGFFALLDMSELKNKKYNEYTIRNEEDLLKFFYQYGYTKFIIGSSIAWPNNNQLIARVTFAKEPEELIEDFYYFNKCVRLLRD